VIDLLQNQVEVWHGPTGESPRSLTAAAGSAPIFQSVAEARKALTSGHTTELRVAALWFVASSEEEFTTATLVAALFDTEEEVRRAASQALSQSRDPDIPTASIENLFAHENDRHDRNSWNAAVADLKNPLAEARISALSTIGNLKRENAFHLITDRFDDECADVRAAAVLALHEFAPGRATELFTEALNVASPTRRSRIVEAIQTSALGRQLIEDLTRKNRERARAALSLLLLMAEINAVRPLIEAIEQHQSAEVRRSLVRILNLSGQSSLAEAAAKRRLGILPQPKLTL
jgi:hypothetical protein